MDGLIQIRNNQKNERGLTLNLNNHKFAILHYNAQSLLNKQMELTVLLNTSLRYKCPVLHRTLAVRGPDSFVRD
jgi:hypothetical protein